VSAQVTQAPHDALGLSPADLLQLQRWMLTARLIDEAALRQNRMGRAPFVVPVSGHEGCQIGTGAMMRRGTDVWLPYYRDLGVVLVAGLTPYEVFLGIFSKAEDPSSGGRQMPSHWGAKRLGIVSHSSPIATQVPHASGIAYAMRYRDEDAVVACWFGEGATSEGDWHEGMNFAGIHRLPVVFVCENNEYATEVPFRYAAGNPTVAGRAASYGMPGVELDGNEVLAIHAAAEEAVQRARQEEPRGHQPAPRSGFPVRLVSRPHQQGRRRREQHHAQQRGRRERGAARDDEPHLVPVPDRPDRPQHRRPTVVVAAHERQ